MSGIDQPAKAPKRAPACSCRSLSGSVFVSLSVMTSPETHAIGRNGDQSVPLCLKPERLAQPELCRLRLHLRRGSKPRLSRVSFPSTVHLPERFRAISPSAAAFAALSRKQVEPSKGPSTNRSYPKRAALSRPGDQAIKLLLEQALGQRTAPSRLRSFWRRAIRAPVSAWSMRSLWSCESADSTASSSCGSEGPIPTP